MNPFIPITILPSRLSGKSFACFYQYMKLLEERKRALRKMKRLRTRVYKLKRNKKWHQALL